MKKWEYKVFGINRKFNAVDDKEIESNLNDLGDKGWELVGILDQISSGTTIPYARYHSETRCNLILLKREKAI